MLVKLPTSYLLSSKDCGVCPASWFYVFRRCSHRSTDDRIYNLDILLPGFMSLGVAHPQVRDLSDEPDISASWFYVFRRC
ncbi:MAG: hypothetical protein AAGA80_28030, partial [Cyanobacteria bacterium P01_F01_bin.143]